MYISPYNRPRRPWRRVVLYLCPYFNLGARWKWVVRAPSILLYPREWPGDHCIGGWVGPRESLDVCWKSRPPPGFDPRTVQPGASCYTYWAIQANNYYSKVKKHTAVSMFVDLKITYQLQTVLTRWEGPSMMYRNDMGGGEWSWPI